MAVASSGTTLIQPSGALVALSVLWLLALMMGAVTAAKGRWGWLLVGLLTA